MRVYRLSIVDVREYLLSDLDHTRIKTILRVVFWSTLFLLILWLIYFAVVTISMPYPIEYREGVAPVMTQFFLKGENPFSLENQPLGTNNYGFVYNWFVLPFAALFGNTLLVHRIVTFFFILLSCLLIFQTTSRINRDRFFALAGAVFIMMGLAARGGLGAYPTAMGVFLFLAGILIPFNRAFDPLALFLSAVLCILAFYTKPYFVLSFGIVASYLFIFISKRKGLFYCLLFGVPFVLSYLLVRYFYILYFIDIFVSNLSNNHQDFFMYAIYQIVELAIEFSPALILGVILIFLNMRTPRLESVSLKRFLRCLDIPALDRPLVSASVNYIAYFFICSLLTFILVLGRHTGTFMTYLYQILLPPFVLLLFQYIKPSTRFTLISCSLVLLNIISFGHLRFNPLFLQQADSTDWARLYQSIDNSKHILNTPALTSEMVRLGIPPVDSGQTQYFYTIDPFPDNKLLGPNYQIVRSDGLQYQETIHQSVIDTKYDKIYLTPLLKNFLVPDDMRQYYYRTNTFVVNMPQTDQNLTVEIWEPKTK
jgi:hypothetical protein